MNKLLFQYHQLEPATWVYLSSLLMVGLFFKFGRLWSVRNLDILLLILLAPGLLLVRNAEQRRFIATRDVAVGVTEAADDSNSVIDGNDPDKNVPDDDLGGRLSAAETVTGDHSTSNPTNARQQHPDYASDELFGYVWLFLVGCLLLIRLLFDATMVRRPLLEPNLSAGGLTFIGISLLVFLLANVIAKPDIPASSTASTADDVFDSNDSATKNGPGFALLRNKNPPRVNRLVAAFAQFAIVVGMVLIAYWHFSNSVMGIGAASMYLMLPYTALMTDQVDHALPAAFLIWAVLWYRYPMTAGVFLGLSALIYYPLFVLPLWISFYWQRGLFRFLSGVLSTLAITTLIVAFLSENAWADIQQMFGIWKPRMNDLGGIWNEQIEGWSSSYRLPLLVLVATLSVGMAIWPAQKNLGTLLSCTAAIMVATQFWHGYGGGIYMAWYLPPLLLTVFRPNLEDRVARTVLGEGWGLRRAAKAA